MKRAEILRQGGLPPVIAGLGEHELEPRREAGEGIAELVGHAGGNQANGLGQGTLHVRYGPVQERAHARALAAAVDGTDTGLSMTTLRVPAMAGAVN
jgi:hypothetical protein